MKEFIINHWDKIIFILPFFFWIYQFYKTKKAEIEIEKLKAKLELEKDIDILNNKKYREGYQNYLNLIFNDIEEKRWINMTKNEKWINDFMRVALLFAWPETIKAFWLYRKACWVNKNNLLYMESLLFSMRKDLWVSNDWLKEYDILQTLVIWDIKQEIEIFEKINSIKKSAS